MEKDLNITQKGLEILEENEVCLETTRATSCWKNNYRLAQAYYEHYGDLEIPRTFRTKNGVDYDENGNNLGNWLFSQRRAYNGKGSIKITPQKIKLLENIGMRWTKIVRGNLEATSEESLMIKKVNEERWIQYYNLAQAFYEHYGDLEVPFDFKTQNGVDYDKDGIKLGIWIYDLRQALKGKQNRKISSERIKLLNEIGMRWDNIDNEEKWMDKYNLLKAYYECYGDFKVPYNFKTKNGVDYDESGVCLGTWVNAQHQLIRKNKMTPERIKLLEEIDFDNNDKMTIWMNKYNLAKVYYKHYGNLEVPFEFKTINGVDFNEEGIRLGEWIRYQRVAVKKNFITPEQIKLLDEIKMRWDNIDRITEWMSKYSLAQAYYGHYGNLEVSRTFRTINGIDYDKEGVHLGEWIANQRRGVKEINTCKVMPEQIKLLNEIGMRWDNIDRMAEWMSKYDLAKLYYEHYGNLEIPFDFKTKNGVDYNEDGIKLGTWIQSQRYLIKQNKMTSERIKLLEKIDFDSTGKMTIWMNKYDLAKVYYEHYGNLEIPAKFKTKNGVDYDEDGIQLGAWIQSQRQSFQEKGSGIINSEQVKLLEEIGMRWDNIDRMAEWTNKYNLAKVYYDYYGDLEIPQNFKTKNGVDYDEDGISLGRWIYTQRQSFKGNGRWKITSEQVKLLEEIGMRWDNIDRMAEWMNKYTLAKLYYDYYGDLEIPQSFKTKNGVDYNEDGIKLGVWISHQRNSYNGKGTGVINSEQIKLLDNIEMKWFTDNIDNKLQNETITEDNIKRKQKEIGNRFYSVLNSFDDKELPTNEKLSYKFLCRFDTKNISDKWIRKYALDKKYYEHYGNLEVPDRFKTKNGVDYDEMGVDLGKWIQTQRSLLKGKVNKKIVLLENIGMNWGKIGREKSSFRKISTGKKWKTKYYLAKIYYEHYGDLEIPFDFKTKNGVDYDEDGIKLGMWIYTQRQSFKGIGNGKITTEQIKLLEEIGMRWDNIDRMPEWQNKYDLAKSYYEHYGNLEIPFDFKTKNGIDYDEEGIKLGIWIYDLRQTFKKGKDETISSERIKLLNDIGMRWDNIDRMSEWMNKYKLAKAYYEHYGDLEIPSKFITKNGVDYDETGINLGKWIHAQRTSIKENKIVPERIKLLEKIGMRWDNIDRMSEWISKYNLAKKYYEYYGNLEMPQTFKTKNGVDYDEAGIKLGRWTNTQRQAFKGNGQWKMTSEQIRLLNEIGMQWDRRYEQWMYKYALAKAYYEHYGNLQVPFDFKTKNGIDYDEDGIKLGIWIYNQRNSFNGKGTGIINYEQVKLLEEIGMKWFADNKDYKLQNEIINEDNIKRKQIEMRNRFYSVLNSFEDEELPTKEELNNKLLCKLNHKK